MIAPGFVMGPASLHRVLWIGAFVALAAGAAPCIAPRQLASAQAGRLEGNVVLTRELSARRSRFRLYAEYGGQPVPPADAADTVEYRNVVIYLDSVPGSPDGAQPSAAPQIRQSSESFVPHVLPVLAGSTVAFPNDDPFFHNVFSLSGAKSFDLGRYPQGSSKSVRFPRPGVVQVFCHIHSDMSAIILVRPNRFFALPDNRGRFVIDGIPPGEYRVVAWHERVRPVPATVRIEPGRATAVEFTIPLTDEQRGRR